MQHPVTDALAALAAQLTAASQVAVACSGGPDSTVLAHAASVVLPTISLVYVDHGLRAEAGQDGLRVKALGARLGVEVSIVAAQVDRARASLEAAARDARYAVLDRLDAQFVLLGHTADDQVETVLMRILRGTGVTGLAGIPSTRGRYLRPLLGVRRSDIIAYLHDHGLEWAEDSMNTDPSFTRSRVRHHWLPALRQENPALDAALLRLAASAGEQRAALDWAAAALLDQARHPDGGWLCPVLAAAPAAVVKRALALVAPAELAAVHLEQLQQLVRRPPGGTVRLELPGIAASRVYERLHFGSPAPEDSSCEAVDIAVAGPDAPYRIRTFTPGDRMRPVRLKGRSRKLSDLFTDAKVPRHLRSRAMVVVRERDGVILWAQYLGAAHDCDIEVSLTGPGSVATNSVE